MKKILMSIAIAMLASGIMILIKVAAFYLYKEAHREGINVDI